MGYTYIVIEDKRRKKFYVLLGTYMDIGVLGASSGSINSAQLLISAEDS
jgi:hypothetical protein